MNKPTQLLTAAIQEHCRSLRLPAIAAQSERLAAEAARANQPHLAYLAELLNAEADQRERHIIGGRLKDARLPRMKTLDEFDFAAAPQVSAKRIQELAAGGYLGRTAAGSPVGGSGGAK